MAGRSITRRDFLNGTRIGLTGAALSPWLDVFGRPARAGPLDYPPARTGMRGSHDGSWEVMHGLVSGKRWDLSASPIDEEFDLIVVGGGISGLAAAWFYRKRRPAARILILENHDDFGGHAKRNEFRVNGKLRLGYGGTQSIDTPSAYSDVAAGLLRELGIDVARFQEAYDHELYDSLGLTEGIFFDAETFGVDRLVAGLGSVPWSEFAAQTPLGEKARTDLVRLYTQKTDYLPGLSRDEKRQRLQRISYRDYLLEYARVDPELTKLFDGLTLSYYAVGADAAPAYWIAEDPWLPGLDGTLVERKRPEEPYIFHFPDGNASIARLLVRALIPDALPGKSMEDVVTARLDYARLDRAESAVRLRLRSTAVDVRRTPQGAEVAYVRDGSFFRARSKHCVLACYNTAIPYLCPQLPEAQRQALAYGIKAPMVYVNVLVRSWRALVSQGVYWVRGPGAFYATVGLDFPVSLGEYRHARSPDEPMVLHLVHVPYHPERVGREQWRAGRRDLLTTSFATFEARLRDQLDRMLRPGGFDSDRDILAITVNRWPHGYAYEPNGVWDPEWASEAEKPWVIGRQPFGPISIANSDAGASAYTDVAIDQAHRAVGELLTRSEAP